MALGAAGALFVALVPLVAAPPPAAGALVPVAEDDRYTLYGSGPLVIDGPGVLANDTRALLDTVVLLEPPGHGWVTLKPDGSFVYTPTGNSGSDSFLYRIRGTLIFSDKAQVQIDRKPATPAPSVKPTPTPAPTATPTPPPTPTPSPKPTPAPTPTPSPRPTPTPRPTLPLPTLALPSILPTARPTPPSPSPSSKPSPTASATPTPSPTPAPTEPPTAGAGWGPGSGSGPGSGGPAGPAGTPGAPAPTPAPTDGRAFAIPGQGDIDRLEQDAPVIDAGSLVFSGFEWQVPGLLLSVPGLLLVVAVAFQLAGGLAWLPVVRRRLGTVQLRTSRIATR